MSKLTDAQEFCLRYLARAQHPVTYDKLPVRQGTVTSLADRGLVTKRLLTVEITDEGRTALLRVLLG